MRVITGKAKGIRLNTLEGMDVRPTTDRVKEGMFSAIQFELAGAEILDLFAGSGQLGIEALSRGAKHAVFIDQSKKSLEIVKENLERTKLSPFAELHQNTAEQYLQSAQEKQFNFIFLDPPYRKQILPEILPKIVRLLKPEGKIIAEHENSCHFDEKISGLLLQKQYFYGKIGVSVFSAEENGT